MLFLGRYDGQVQVPTETVDKTCNVMDRLPPFQYRYMPVGKVKPSNSCLRLCYTSP